ncbi:MAG: malto-oligosyltrehalose synthase [Dongiaceae bacterium]
MTDTAGAQDRSAAHNSDLAVPGVPTATYRLQLNRDFTFADATRLVPYLKDLGISHVYLSSYLKARPGSTHGYDVVDHNAINPEIGDWDQFEAFCAALRHAGMGQILDFIPNHMGIGHADNAAWLDLLEWGRDSSYADFFDINWRPRHPMLQGKVLVPLLGDQYGNVLERGELQLKFERETGTFSIWYFEHRFPIHPATYAAILRDVPIASRQLALMAAADPSSAPAAATELKRELARLAASNPDIVRRLDAVVARINGKPEVPDSFQELHQLLEQQRYRLAFWRVAADEINYRRFFDINELAGIRMEDPKVFESTHRLVGCLIAEGKLNGLRLDHVDGLLDPGGYFQRLQNFATERTDMVYLLVEKILARHERLREGWPIAGTTGYEFINLINGLYVDSSGERTLDHTYRRFLDRSSDFDEIVRTCKLLVMDTMLSSELHRLAAELDALSESHWNTRDYTQERLLAALREVVASFPVYRTYVDAHGATAEDRRDIDWAVSQARKTYAGPDPEILDFVRAALTTELADVNPAFDRTSVLRFAQRFQQYTGPVTAKSLEDTCFYRFNRLLSLNEVGGDPRQFGTSVAAFHRLMQDRAKAWPNALSAMSTHDTKRGADLRARLNVLSEIAPEWNKRVRRWATLNRYKRTKLNELTAPTPNDEYMIYQTLLGAWPFELVGSLATQEQALKSFRERVQSTVLKSIREAKRRTSWNNPNEAYEAACLNFVQRVLDVRRPNPFLEDFTTFQQRIARIGVLNSLSQTVLQLTAPGVPDIYQGCETWDFSMVDPDNRRAVDFTQRRYLLDQLKDPASASKTNIGHWLEDWRDGRIKLAIVAALLECRRRRPALFRHGSYEPIVFDHPLSDHVVGFSRRHDAQICVVIVGRLFAKLLGNSDAVYPGGAVWADMRLDVSDLPARPANALTGNTVSDLSLRHLLAELPVAVLVG